MRLASSLFACNIHPHIILLKDGHDSNIFAMANTKGWHAGVGPTRSTMKTRSGCCCSATSTPVACSRHSVGRTWARRTTTLDNPVTRSALTAFSSCRNPPNDSNQPSPSPDRGSVLQDLSIEKKVLRVAQQWHDDLAAPLCTPLCRRVGELGHRARRDAHVLDPRRGPSLACSFLKKFWPE